MVLLSRCCCDVADASQTSEQECFHKKPSACEPSARHWRCIAVWRLYGNMLKIIWKTALRLIYPLSHRLEFEFNLAQFNWNPWHTVSRIWILFIAGKSHSYIQIQFPDVSPTELVWAVPENCKHLFLTANYYHGKNSAFIIYLPILHFHIFDKLWLIFLWALCKLRNSDKNKLLELMMSHVLKERQLLSVVFLNKFLRYLINYLFLLPIDLIIATFDFLAYTKDSLIASIHASSCMLVAASHLMCLRKFLD